MKAKLIHAEIRVYNNYASAPDKHNILEHKTYYIHIASIATTSGDTSLRISYIIIYEIEL